MARFFNTAGVCEPRKHYMLPPERRLPSVRDLIDEEAYFVVHAPRQSGKSTCFHHLARELVDEGRYAALLASFEVAQTARDDVERGVSAVVEALDIEAGRNLPEELRPPAPEDFRNVAAETRLNRYLGDWCAACPRPVVLFLDEIDALFGKSLLTVLHQLRAGYRNRPQHFPHSVVLIGLRDVRDYKVREVPGAPDSVMRELQELLGTSSPFNIKVESLTLRNFTAGEVAELYDQHTEETGQGFTAEAKELAYGLTRGQPWLVNALARQIVMREARDRVTTIGAAHVERGKEALILRRDTHLDSLVHRLQEARIRRVIEPILAGELPAQGVPEADAEFVEDLGLVAMGPQGYGMANPIYREIVPRALTSMTERFLVVDERSFVRADGHLDFDRLLDEFVVFWRQHAESFLNRQPYSEAAAQLVCMAFMQRVVNGGGTIDREYAVGSGRIDLCIRWPLCLPPLNPPEGTLPDDPVSSGGSRGGDTVERFALELKIWRHGKSDPLNDGLTQIGKYLERLGLESGTLVIFDQRPNAPPFVERGKREEHTVDARDVLVLRL